jgi:SAM-dependent methyltransferase
MSRFSRETFFEIPGLWYFVIDDESETPPTMKSLIDLLKKVPIDLGQGSVADRTEGKRIAKRLTPEGVNRHALDLGARYGAQTQWLREQGYEVTSVDVDPRFVGCDRLDANAVLPYEDETFDFVWCSEVIEHLENPAFSLSELIRVTKLGGRLILTTPNSYMWLFSFLNLIGLTPQKLQRDDHLHFFDLAGVKALHADAEILGYFPYAGFKLTVRSDWMLKWLTPTFVIQIDRPAAASTNSVRKEG